MVFKVKLSVNIMGSNFATAMTDNKTTLNGATSLATPDISGKYDGRLSLYFKSVRDIDKTQFFDYMRKTADESVRDAFILVFYIRDCRGGKGERELGRLGFTWLLLFYPVEFSKVAYLIPEYGRWDDLINLFPTVIDLSGVSGSDEKVISTQNIIVKIVTKQMVEDKNNMEQGNTVSICAKWLPTEKCSLDRKYKIVNTICNDLGITPEMYRKNYTSPLRQYISIVERYMSENRWNEIDFNKVPSCAMKRLKNVFEKHSPAEFATWKSNLENGKTKVNGKQLFPHELVSEFRLSCISNEVSEAQWKVLENELLSLGSLKDALCICDVSGSMKHWDSGLSEKDFNFSPIDVSISLSLLIANSVQGPFHNHIITFSENPSFHVVEDGKLCDKIKSLSCAHWGMSTNFQAVFELILNQAKKHNLPEKDMPKKLFVFSDMQFDSATSDITNFREIESKYSQSGYIRPQIIFWNISAKNTDFPVSVSDDGTALVSGFSPSIIKSILNNRDFSPKGILLSTLEDERYKPIADTFC